MSLKKILPLLFILFHLTAKAQLGLLVPDHANRGQSLVTTITTPGGYMTISSGIGSSYHFSLQQGNYVIPETNYTYTSSGLGFATAFQVTFVIPFSALQGLYDFHITRNNDAFFNYSLFDAFEVFETGMQGKIFFDNNQNGIYDSLDQPLNNQSVLISPQNILLFSDVQGNYRPYLNAGYFNDSLILPANFSYTGPSSYNLTIPPYTTGLNFGLYTPPSSSMIHHFVSDAGRIRCARPSLNFWEVSSESNNIQQGTVSLIKESFVNFLGATVNPSSSSGDTIRWNYTLNPFQQLSAELNIQGAFNNSSTVITIIDSLFDQSGTFVTQSVDSFHTTIACSHDPNEKATFPEGDGAAHYTLKTDELRYMIRFQNCGTDTAFDITIRDTISPYFDMSTFHVLYASSPVCTQVESGNHVRFTFDNIQLPDSSSDELHSHGELIYAVTPLSTVTDNTIVRNSASIYFDLNDRISTNTTFNTMESQVVQDISGRAYIGEASLFPNPVSDKSVLTLPDNKEYLLEIYPVTGEESISKIIHGSFTVNAADYPGGIYFYRLVEKASGECRRGKFVVLK